MKRFIILIFLSAAAVNLTGCWFVVGGAAGAAGAYVLSNDSIEVNTDKNYDSLWNAALTVARIRGKIQIEDPAGGRIEAAVGSTLIKISLIRITEATTKLKVSGRKHHMPDRNLAEEIFIKILEEAGR
jgi:hypothetical protein